MPVPGDPLKRIASYFDNIYSCYIMDLHAAWQPTNLAIIQMITVLIDNDTTERERRGLAHCRLRARSRGGILQLRSTNTANARDPALHRHVLTVSTCAHAVSLATLDSARGPRTLQAH